MKAKIIEMSIYLISQGFKIKPQVFITLQHEHSDRPFDSMNLWLEDVGKNEFYVCMRELMTFDGIHSDLKVVSGRE